MNRMKLNEREGKLVTLLVLVLIVMLGARYLVIPAYLGWQASRDAFRQSQLSDWRTGQGNQSTENEAGPSAAHQFTYVQASSPEEMHYYFSGLINSKGLELDNIIITENKGNLPGRYTRMDVSISLTGEQPQVIGFLNDIDESSETIVIKSISLSQNGKNVLLDAAFNVYCEMTQDSALPDAVPQRPAPADGFRFANSGGVA